MSYSNHAYELCAYSKSRFREIFRSVFYMPTNCILACFERYKRRTNSQRSLMVLSKGSRNSYFCCKSSNADDKTQESNSSSSRSVTSRINQCGCQDTTQIFGVTQEIKLCNTNKQALQRISMRSSRLVYLKALEKLQHNLLF